MSILNRKRQADEMIRCRRDPVYFFNTYVKIQHPTRGPVPFATFPFQDECVKLFLGNRFVIVNKSRQLGLSTLTAAYVAWFVLFHRSKEVLIIATKLATAQNFIRKVKFVIKNLPKWMVVAPISGDNKTTIEFGDPCNSKVQAVPTSEDAGRSEALSLLIVDEAAHIRDFDELWKGLYPTLSTGGRAIIISTPKGQGNQFHKLWVDAQAGDNPFAYIELPWHVHPERDQAWYENECKNLSKQGIAQELNCDFLASGDTYLNSDDIIWVGEEVREPVDRQGDGRNVWIWKPPMVDREVKYIIGADASSGKGNDFSAFHILNVTLGEVAAEFKGKVPPDVFATILHEYATKYNNALVCIERNTGWGQHANSHLINILKYTNVYFENHTIPLGGYIPPDLVAEAGFDTSPQSRPRILAKMEEVIRAHQVKLYSSRLYDELKSFVVQNNKPQAQRNCNDDLVLALAIALWIFDASAVNSQFADKLNSAMLAGFGMSTNDYQNMQGNGHEVLPRWAGMIPYMGDQHGPNQQRLRPKRDDPTNLDWLYRR